MSKIKNYAILLLSLTTLGSAYLAWSQSKQLAELQQIAAPVVPHEKPTLKESPQIDSALIEQFETKTKTSAIETKTKNPKGKRFARREAIRKAKETPEFKRMQALVQTGALDRRYAALFAKLNLSPADLKLFKELLLEKRSIRTDVIAAARTQGMNFRNDREAINELVEQNRAEIDQTIRTELGDHVFEEYTRFGENAPYRSLVNRLDQKLSYSANPLTDAQQDQLINMLARTLPQSANQGLGAGLLRTGIGQQLALETGTSPQNFLTQQAMEQARGLLTPDQFSVLEVVQNEQQAAVKMSELVRSQVETTE